MGIKQLRQAVAIGAVAVLLSACGGDSTEPSSAFSGDPEYQALVDEAKAAGPVTFYSMIDESALRTISESFTEKYGVEVEPVRLVTADLIQRYSAEASSGKTVADVLLLTDSPFFADAVGSGWITPFNELDLPGPETAFPEAFVGNDGATPIVSLIPTDTVINTDNVSDPPTTWEDYADPKFKGKLMLAEPDSSPANASFWSLMRQTYGDGFLQDVAANEPRWMNSAVPVTQAVAAGEAEMGHPGVAAIFNNLKAQGAPLELVQLSPTTGPEAALAVSASSPNPAGAKLLASYLTGEEGNQLLNDETSAVSPFDDSADERFTRTKDIESVDAAEIRSLLGLG